MSIETEPVLLPKHWPHGGGVEAAAAAWQCEVSEILDLSTGLHPAGAPVWLSDWLKAHAALVAHYPDMQGEPARSVLARALSIPVENVLITAGAQAAIEVIFQALGWQSMAIQVPCYSEPLRCARRAGCDVCAFESGPPPAADVLWLTSPSNPGGELHWPCPSPLAPHHSTICLDESYMPFAQRCQLGLLAGAIRIGSLTKTFCIPGLRLGYVVAEREVVERLQQALPPWPTSTLALHLLPQLLQEADRRDEQIDIARMRLQDLLVSAAWQVQPSQASFVLALPAGGMPDFDRARILVRQFPEWPQLSGWVRLGLPGSDAAWQRLIAVLK